MGKMVEMFTSMFAVGFGLGIIFADTEFLRIGVLSGAAAVVFVFLDWATRHD